MFTFQVVPLLVVDELFGKKLLDEYEAIFDEVVVGRPRWTVFSFDHLLKLIY